MLYVVLKISLKDFNVSRYVIVCYTFHSYRFIYLWQRRRCMFRPCARVCLSVCVQDYSKMRAWIWMKCCVSTDVVTRTNWLTFEPDPGHSPDAGTGFLSPIGYALQCGNVEFYYVGKIPCTYWYWGQSKQWRMVLRHGNTVLSMKQHVTKVASICFFHLRRLHQVRHRVGKDITIRLVLAVIMSRLDYCNSVSK